MGVICADRLCFGLGQQISLIDQTIEDARQKLRDIVMVAYDSLDPALKRELPITRSNTGELAVKFVRHEEAKTNAMFAGTHARGGANSFLWVSEWGVIQSSDLTRSEEILTGALPSVGDGVCVVETTWHGGRNGHLWSLVKSALETPEQEKGPLDWRVAFFPWRDESAYSDAVPRPVGEETARYFAGLPACRVWHCDKQGLVVAESNLYTKPGGPHAVRPIDHQFPSDSPHGIYVAEGPARGLERTRCCSACAGRFGGRRAVWRPDGSKAQNTMSTPVKLAAMACKIVISDRLPPNAPHPQNPV